MKKAWIVSVCMLVAAVFGLWGADVVASSDDAAKIATLVHEMGAMGKTSFESLESIPIRRYEVPGPGVDVMRARLRETYTVDGVGTDTVELSGWIAVKHGQARPAAGYTDLNWSTAVLSTEFVGMDLKGYSETFGPVHVRLDEARPVQGQVGRIEMPEFAKVALKATLTKNSAAAETGKTEDGAVAGEINPASECVAQVHVTIDMPDLGLSMATKDSVYWYSLVDTIPPVGHTASVAVQPVRLTTDGREVATLESGIVDFREVVRHVPLADERSEKVAAGH